MREALEKLNEIVAEGILPTYAIGGGIGASFYLEARETEDLEVLAALPRSDAGCLEGANIRFGAWLVQIFDAETPLLREALAEAADVVFDGIPTRVLTAEHLCAICLEAGHPEDFLRVVFFLEEEQVDLRALALLAKRYSLVSRLNSVLSLGQEFRARDVDPLLALVLADKEISRRQARMKSWPEKIAVIERLQKNSRLAKAAMQCCRRPKTDPQMRPMPISN